MIRALITGTGNMGRAIATSLAARGDEVVATIDRHSQTLPDLSAGVDAAFEFSHASTLLRHVDIALDAGCGTLVIGTTGFKADDETGTALRERIETAGARAVVAPTFSLAAVLFAELAEQAAVLFGRFPDYDPYVFEHHRRAKPDRPSGTALAVAARLLPHLESKREARLPDGAGAPDPDVLEVVALRAGSHPGMHIVGFDAPGESLEIRVTARDRSAYVAGAILAADTLLEDPGRKGISDFASLIRERTRSA